MSSYWHWVLHTIDHCFGVLLPSSMIQYNFVSFPEVYKQDWSQKEEKDQKDRFLVDGTPQVLSMLCISILSYFNAASEPRSIIQHEVFNGTQSLFWEALDQLLAAAHVKSNSLRSFSDSSAHRWPSTPTFFFLLGSSSLIFPSLTHCGLLCATCILC